MFKKIERAKAQALFLKPDLNMSEMYFFKIMVDNRLVDMEEASPEAEVSKDATIDNLILKCLRGGES